MSHLLSAPSGIFGLSIFWTWAIPLALVAANALVILLIRRDNRRHDEKVAALLRLTACIANTRRAMLMGAEAGRISGGDPYIDATSAPSREEYEALLAARAQPADDGCFLRSIGISPK